MGLDESAREESCQPLWVDKYLLIDADHSLRSKARCRASSCSEIRFEPSRSLYYD